MSLYNFKRIQVVPNGKEFMDIVLTRTQRKTPTVVHPGYAIGRIRKFYMRKVKYTQSTLHDKLSQILTDFPVLDQIHPFYADLMNVLYDKDHYKLALGQLNTARHLIDSIAKDYLRLLKFGDSLYRCKQLKRAALGRMMKVLIKNSTSLSYLEEVRQHLARLPSIDPNTRTLLICGYPNVGKSSFINKITRAKVDVQPYAFTTKSLFVGHMDYRFSRWQVIDTPGILDHPLEERNTIEMQSVTALAHLRCAVLFFIDISERCGYSIEQQCNLFKSLKPLFNNKPLVLAMTKIDLINPNDLAPHNKKLIEDISNDDSVILLPMSTHAEEGVSEVKKAACEALLAQRVQVRLRGAKMSEVSNKMHLAEPVSRDDIERPPQIPETVLMNKKEIAEFRRKEWEEQVSLYYDMDPDYTGVDQRKRYLLDDPEWRFDRIPEILDGKNISDFWCDDLEEKLAQIEREELIRLRKLEQEAMAMADDQFELTPEQEEKLAKIREKKAMIITKSRFQKQNGSTPLSRNSAARTKSLDELQEHLTSIGLNGEAVTESIRSDSRSRSKSRTGRSVSESRVGRKRTRSEYERSLSVTPGEGFSNVRQKVKAQRLERSSTRKLSQDGRRGTSDRHVYDLKPKHLYSGKMDFKRDRR
jgi:nucleolar GTP-binding protein